MRLTDTINKIKASVPYILDLPKDLFIVALILLVALGSFMLGKLSFLDEKYKGELKITKTEPLSENSATAINRVIVNTRMQNSDGTSSSQEVLPRAKVGGMYVGSRSGKTFYLPWCAGVKRILEKNKVWFKDKTEAINKGYKPSSSCKGI